MMRVPLTTRLPFFFSPPFPLFFFLTDDRGKAILPSPFSPSLLSLVFGALTQRIRQAASLPLRRLERLHFVFSFPLPKVSNALNGVDLTLATFFPFFFREGKSKLMLSFRFPSLF